MTTNQTPDPAVPARFRSAFRQQLTGAGQPGLTPRIRSQIELHDQSSEVLIKIIQLVIVTIWAGLYWLSPKGGAGNMFAPVPWALAAYFAFNLTGLLWARRARLPDWAVLSSIVVDVGILMLLIWSFHIQYGQPPSFYLKAPTLLYVFIFIALRALRFEARFVIFTGIAAAAGWLTLVAYAIYSAHGMGVTRDYIAYLTGNEILLGAEFDKIITIIMVAAIIGVALARANGLLVRATSEAQAARDLSRFFDRDVANSIRNAGEDAVPGSGSRIDAAILNVDLRGFTAWAARHDAADVLAVLIAYQKRIVGIIQRHGGSIDKFMGDGIMATFGTVRGAGTHAADALRAVDEIVADTKGWSSDPALSAFAGKVNAALASGPVVSGTIGDDSRLEYTVIGSTVNLSAKLEKANKLLKTRAIASEETWKAALAQGYQPAGRPRWRKSPVPGTGRVAVLG